MKSSALIALTVMNAVAVVLIVFAFVFALVLVLQSIVSGSAILLLIDLKLKI